METRINGRALSDYKDFRVTETGLAVPEAEPLYVPAVSNGYPPDDFIIDSSLILYLPLYLLKGSKFKSVDRYQRTCEVTGALWRPNGRYFDGTNDEITLPSAVYQAFDSTDDFSVLAWFYIDGTIAATARNIFGLIGTAANRPQIAMLQLGSNDKMYVGVRNAANDFTNSVQSADIPSVGWHFAVLRHDASDRNKIYLDVDGVNEGSNNDYTITFATTDFNSGKVGSFKTGTNYFKDVVGEVWVYSRLLSFTEGNGIRSATIWRYQ